MSFSFKADLFTLELCLSEAMRGENFSPLLCLLSAKGFIPWT